MAYTEHDLAALDRAIASGRRTVSIADRSVTYNSFNELLRARAHVAAALQSDEQVDSPFNGRTWLGRQDGKGL